MPEPDQLSNDEDDQQHVGIPRKDLRALRDRSRKLDDAEKRAADAERKLAFAQAGIDLSDKRAGLFVKGYDGEHSPDAIKAAWEDLFGQPAPPPDADLEAQERVARAQTGADTRPPDPAATFYSQLAQATSEREADALLAQARAAGLQV